LGAVETFREIICERVAGWKKREIYANDRPILGDNLPIAEDFINARLIGERSLSLSSLPNCQATTR
jgi:hypothetical protein